MYRTLFGWILVLAVSTYPLALALANVSGVKVNLAIAGGILLLSVAHFVRIKTRFVFFCSLLLCLTLKVAFLGFFGFKEALVVVTGPIVFICFSDFFDGLSEQHKNALFKFTLLVSGGICVIAVLQDNGILPHSIGAMGFINSTGYDITGEFSGKIRPSAYLYHPYDTALAMVPFISYLLSFWITSKFRFLFTLIVASVIVYALGLKVLYIYALLLVFLLFLGMQRKVSSPMVFICLFAWTGLIAWIISGNFLAEYAALSAGRLFIWNIMLNYYYEHVNLATLLLGYNQDILSNHPLWSGDETYTTHNQYLYMIIHLGWVFIFVSIYLMNLVLAKKRLINFFILLLFCSFALTGDLFVFLTCWICMCQLYVLSWKVESKMRAKP